MAPPTHMLQGPGKSLLDAGPQFPPKSQWGLEWWSVCLSNTVVGEGQPLFGWSPKVCLVPRLLLLAGVEGFGKIWPGEKKAGSTSKGHPLPRREKAGFQLQVCEVLVLGHFLIKRPWKKVSIR